MPYSGRHRCADGVNSCYRCRLRIYPLLAVSFAGERTSIEVATSGEAEVRSRRDSATAVRPGECPLTERTAGV
jgi:hypothetical protein